jgi:hypothetical protein
VVRCPFWLIVLWLRLVIQIDPEVPWYMHQIIQNVQGGNVNKHFVPHSWARSLSRILLCLLLWQKTSETHPCLWNQQDQVSAPWIMRCIQPLATQFALPEAPTLNWFGSFSSFGLWAMFDSWPIYRLVFLLVIQCFDVEPWLFHRVINCFAQGTWHVQGNEGWKMVFNASSTKELVHSFLPCLPKTSVWSPNTFCNHSIYGMLWVCVWHVR